MNRSRHPRDYMRASDSSELLASDIEDQSDSDLSPPSTNPSNVNLGSSTTSRSATSLSHPVTVSRHSKPASVPTLGFGARKVSQTFGSSSLSNSASRPSGGGVAQAQSKSALGRNDAKRLSHTTNQSSQQAAGSSNPSLWRPWESVARLGTEHSTLLSASSSAHSQASSLGIPVDLFGLQFRHPYKTKLANDASRQVVAKKREPSIDDISDALTGSSDDEAYPERTYVQLRQFVPRGGVRVKPSRSRRTAQSAHGTAKRAEELPSTASRANYSPSPPPTPASLPNRNAPVPKVEPASSPIQRTATMSPRAQAVGRPGLPKVYIQDACLLHRWIRTRDKSNVFERPERIRAVKIGIAAAYAHLEFAAHAEACGTDHPGTLANVRPPFDIVQSMATMDMQSHPAAHWVHGRGNQGREYGYKYSWTHDLRIWCDDIKNCLSRGESEIAPSCEQDLYLCHESYEAFEGALATVCEAVDGVMAVRPVGAPKQKFRGPDSRAFVVIRPPGHHCDEDEPMGFGFVNNVMVGALQSYLAHGIKRVVIFDYDLHHGNGTQSIVRTMNYNRRGNPNPRYDEGPVDNAPLVFYGSMHDILSYPCEEGHTRRVEEASLSMHGTDGEWIENIHLQAYATDAQFWEQYEQTYAKLFRTATKFIENTGGTQQDDVLVFISSGFDASEHETEDMSRHGRKVPTSFYHRFTRDACRFADKYANGRVVSLLEGGYSDLALISGTISHVTALADTRGITHQDWWSVKRLNEVEKATKKRRGRAPRTDNLDGWLQRTVEILKVLETPGESPVTMPYSFPLLTNEMLVSLSPSTRRSAMKRAMPQTSIQTRAKRFKGAADPGRIHLGTSVDSEDESSDEDPLARTTTMLRQFARR